MNPHIVESLPCAKAYCRVCDGRQRSVKQEGLVRSTYKSSFGLKGSSSKVPFNVFSGR